MKPFLFLAGLTLIATNAQAADLRLYFSTTGLTSGVLTAPPPEYLSHTNPTVTAGSPVYLYATVVDPGTWLGIGLTYTGSSGPVSLVNSTFLGLRRWFDGADYLGTLDGANPTNLVSVFDLGIANPYSLDPFDDLAITAPDNTVAFYLGSVTPATAGSVFLHVGQGGIVRHQGSAANDLIYFGWDDAALHGNQFGAASTIPDLTVVPEPGSFLSLSVAVLLLAGGGRVLRAGGNFRRTARMPRALSTLVLLTVLSSVASASSIRIYFSTTGLAAGELTTPPPEHTSHANPVVPVGIGAFLYADVIDAGHWVGLGLNYSGADGNVAQVNPTVLPGIVRWEPIHADLNGRLNGTDDTNSIASLGAIGLLNPYAFDAQDASAIANADGTVSYYLGSVTTTAQGTVFLRIGHGAVVSEDGSGDTDHVFFGWGDDFVHGDAIGAASTLADLTIVPEPASAIALSVAAFLLLRRRR